MRPLLIAILVSLLMASPAAAHLSGGADVVVDGLILDFGYDPEPPEAGATTTLAFNLADEKTLEAVVPVSVWVRVAQGDAIAFAGTLTPANGSATVQTVLPSAGVYEVTARYVYGGREIEGKFAVSASPPPTPPTVPKAGASIAALAALLALGLGYFIGRRSMRR